MLVEGKDFQPALRRVDVRPGPLVAVGQGLWPGIRAEKEGSTEARPTGAPWVETNTGYLRYLRSSLGPASQIWLTNRPPEKQVLSGQRYVQAIGDAAMSGARWLLTLDRGFTELMRQRDPRIQESWKRINDALVFYEANRADGGRAGLQRARAAGGSVVGRFDVRRDRGHDRRETYSAPGGAGRQACSGRRGQCADAAEYRSGRTHR